MTFRYKAVCFNKEQWSWLVYRWPEQDGEDWQRQPSHEEAIVWHAGSEEAAIITAKASGRWA
jgi:hypothetical protein